MGSTYKKSFERQTTEVLAIRAALEAAGTVESKLRKEMVGAKSKVMEVKTDISAFQAMHNKHY